MERSSGGQLCGIQFSAHSRNKKTILWVANPQHEEDDGGEDDDGAMINVFVLVKVYPVNNKPYMLTVAKRPRYFTDTSLSKADFLKCLKENCSSEFYQQLQLSLKFISCFILKLITFQN